MRGYWVYNKIISTKHRLAKDYKISPRWEITHYFIFILLHINFFILFFLFCMVIYIVLCVLISYLIKKEGILTCTTTWIFMHSNMGAFEIKQKVKTKCSVYDINLLTPLHRKLFKIEIRIRIWTTTCFFLHYSMRWFSRIKTPTQIFIPFSLHFLNFLSNPKFSTL